MAHKNVPLEIEFESFIFEFEQGGLNDCIKKKKLNLNGIISNWIYSLSPDCNKLETWKHWRKKKMNELKFLHFPNSVVGRTAEVFYNDYETNMTEDGLEAIRHISDG